MTKPPEEIRPTNASSFCRQTSDCSFHLFSFPFRAVSRANVIASVQTAKIEVGCGSTRLRPILFLTILIVSLFVYLAMVSNVGLLLMLQHAYYSVLALEQLLREL